MDILVVKILIWLISTTPVYENIPVRENLCEECHKELAINKTLHPAAESCDNCHQSNGKEHPLSGEKCFNLAQSVPDLCYNCHEAKNTKATKHPPADGGECLTCHSPHSSANKSLLADYPASNLCVMCHEINIDNKKSIHKPVKEGKCINCHDPHQSDMAKLLKKDSKELCLSCHNKTYKNGTKTIENISQDLKTGNTIHGAIEGDGCLTCHKGHTSDLNSLLTDKFPESTYTNVGKEGYSLCFTCHDSQIIEAENTNSTGFRNGEKNIHYVHLTGSKSRSCAVCHNVHGSPNKHLINTEVPFGNWKMAMNYKVSDNGGSCMPGCHQEYKYDRAVPEVRQVRVINTDSIQKQQAMEKAKAEEEARKFKEEMEKARIADEDAKKDLEQNSIQNKTNIPETIGNNNIDSLSVNEQSKISQQISESEDEQENTESNFVKLNNIKFEFDSVTFSFDFEKELNNVARVMTENTSMKVEILGYTDNVGDPEYNKALSLKRAKTAKILLINRGIDPERISVKGCGDEKPIKSNKTEKGRMINRRIEFKFTYK